MNNEIGVLGGGELQLRINGAKAEVEEIKALQPSDIIRIEYHDNPGLRYGNAEVVLDYIVRRPETGGNFGVDLSQGMNAMWGEYNVFGKVNHISMVCTGIMKRNSIWRTERHYIV